MDTVQWPQEIGLVKPMEELVMSSTTSSATCTTITRPHLMERRTRPQKEQALHCPRCNSTNTKFCYYNNYSLTQPRYFCKTCRRYWTEGGSLRNVPVGGGSRKNKRSTSSSSTATPTSNATTSTITAASSTVSTSRKLPPELSPTPISLSTSSQNPKFHEGQDLNLAFPHHGLPEFNDFPNLESSSNNNSSSSNGGSNPCTAVGALSAMELLRSGMGARGLGPFVPMPMPEYPAGFGVGLQEFRPPTLGFPLDGVGGGGGGSGGGGVLQGVQESTGGRLLFPFENLKPVLSSTATEFEQNGGQGGDQPGFWNGMMGGGGSW